MSPARSLLVFIGAAVVFACGGGEAPREVSAETRRLYRDLLIDREGGDCRRPGPEALTPRDMLADVEVLERVLRRGYAGFELAGDEEAWAEVFSSLRAELPTEPSDPRAFRDRLVTHLAFADDNHLGFTTLSADGERSWRSTSGHRQAHVLDLALREQDGSYVDTEGRTLLSCAGATAAESVRPVLGEGTSIDHRAIVLSADPISEARCVVRDAGGAEAELVAEANRVDIADARGDVFEQRAADFPWLRVRSLATSYGGALDRFVATGPELRDAPVIVLDVRRMAGGSDRFLLRWFKELTSEGLPYFHTRNLESEATLQGALNFWGCIAQRSTGADAGGRRWLTARVAQAERQLDEAMRARGPFRELEREQSIIYGLASSPFRGRLLLVVDRGCASACETSVLMARHFPHALVVGENTEGTMKVGELRSYRLPKSSIYVSAGHRVHEDPSEPNVFPEGVGYQPDLWLVGDDVEDQIARLATCLGNADCARGLDAELH